MKTDSKGYYRKDIEGLRAVAVLPVLAFHVGFTAVPGGFVGVDIFFVISGFLITQLLHADIQSDRFSLLTFYERRIRRIGPVLFATLIATFILGLRYCLPDEMASMAKSLVAATVSASNFYFWSVANYFDDAATTKPLLHTWSLAVEEQFYVVWPLFLAFGWRYFRNRLVAVIAIIAALSFALSAVGAFRSPTATFYLPFSRLWELAAGGLIALGAVPAVRGAWTSNVLASIGIALILGSVFLIRASMPFPGLLAIPPCAGAALIIIAGRGGESLVGRTLALRPIAFIGAISYSLYMWHWPIAVFQRNDAFLVDGLSSAKTKLVILAVSLIVATLSYYVIEQPFRSGKLRPARGPLMRLAAAAAIVSVALGLTASAAGGFPSRFSKQELDTYARLHLIENTDWRANACFLYDSHTEWKFAPECLTLEDQRKHYLVLGDSHGAELWTGLHAVYGNIDFLQATAAGCLPTVSHSFKESPQCTAVMDEIMQGFLARTPVDNVVLVARWSANSMAAVAATLDWMKERHIAVTLVGPTAVYDAPVPRLVIKAMRGNDPAMLERHQDAGMKVLDSQMAQLAASHAVPYISLLGLECTEIACFKRAWPELFDEEHFNTAGSRLIARGIQKVYPAFGL